MHFVLVKNVKNTIFGARNHFLTILACHHIVFGPEMKGLDLDTTFKPYLGILKSPLLGCAQGVKFWNGVRELG